MRSLVLALLVFGLFVPVAHAQGLSASGGGRYGNTTGLVAGRPAVLVSTLYLADGDEDCHHPRSLRAVLTPPRGVSVRGPLTLTPRARAHRMINATWHVRAAGAGVKWAWVKWEGTGPDGERCTDKQHLRVVATSAPPRLEVVAAVRYHDATGVIVRAELPGVKPKVGEAFDAFFSEQHVLGRAQRGPQSLLRPSPYVGEHFNYDGLNCLLVRGARASVAYGLRFTWNHDIGAVSIVRNGSIAVQAAPRNETERTCEVQYHPTDCSPCDGNESALGSLAKPMTAIAEHLTSRS
jgi:hypothetical protein